MGLFDWLRARGKVANRNQKARRKRTEEEEKEEGERLDGS